MALLDSKGRVKPPRSKTDCDIKHKYLKPKFFVQSPPLTFLS